MSTSPRDSADRTITSAHEPKPVDTPAAPDEDLILTGRKLAVVFVAMLLSVLLVALDQTILATALPRIASDFNNFSLQGWVATSFILAQTVFLLFYGQLLRIFAAKWTMIVAVFLFELGSLVCALAPNVDALIAGRAVSGLGAAGIFVSMLQIISQVTRLEDRPRLLGFFGALFGLSSIVGPLLGGAFVDNVSWRWCFWINLPLGGVSIAGILFLLKASPPLGSDPNQRTWAHLWQQALRLDYGGAILVAGFVTSLDLALQWGGNTKPWGDTAVIVCFVVSGVLAILAICWEIRLGERAMVPTAIFKSRSIYAIMVYCFLSRFSLLLFSYYIPIFYQAARHHTATKSGIDLLPFMLSTVASIIISGQLVGKFGRYYPFLLVAPVFLAIGSGLLYTISPTTASAKIVGFQILAGVGTGLGMQNSLLSIQVEFRDKSEARLLGQATSMASFAQFFGGTIGLGVAGKTRLCDGARKVPTQVRTRSAGRDRSGEPNGDLRRPTPGDVGKTEICMCRRVTAYGVVRSYTDSLRIVFILGVPLAGLGLITAVFIKNLKIERPPVDKQEPAVEETV
ncbi:Major facilitator transporter-like protein [Mycena kentingensis (nom. inval.)]|nr:Major facilitator transporter-like protein [Mycena kentingensis (nom. inval.)]